MYPGDLQADGDRLQSANIDLGIVCPMANESGTAIQFVNDVLRQCQSESLRSVTFFAVLDHASKDGTLELLRDLAKRQTQLRVIWAPQNRSVVDAYIRGYREAINSGCDWILEIDAGYSHQPSEIPPSQKRLPNTQSYPSAIFLKNCGTMEA